mmetsp:Transcript_37036/g.31283  ORF Transcript_37036/g.31283 Transcript_37036/m.31283 type:complete len:94 (-) Transcript_37036:1-282(-)
MCCRIWVSGHLDLGLAHHNTGAIVKPDGSVTLCETALLVKIAALLIVAEVSTVQRKMSIATRACKQGSLQIIAPQMQSLLVVCRQWAGSSPFF